MGNVLTVTEPELAQKRKLYLERYANSKCWVDCEDFSIYRMEVVGSLLRGRLRRDGLGCAPLSTVPRNRTRWLTP
jgi:hypothetical protein